MCGLWGVVGRNPNLGYLRMLGVLNQSRGRDATGFFNTRKAGKSNWIKNAEQVETWLRDGELREWLEQSAASSWAICGHTRNSTRGGSGLTKNAHPFEYGPICGSHNGILEAPVKYDVDSQYAMDLLSQNKPGEYQKALGDVAGWYVLTWFDQRDQSLYMLNWTGDLWLRHVGEHWYYSSSGTHLATALGYNEGMELKHGKVIRFRWDRVKGQVECKQLEDFTGKKRETVVLGHWQGGSQGGRGGRYAGHGYGDEYDPDYDFVECGQGFKRRWQQQSHNRTNAPVGGDWTKLTGWVRLFSNGLWYAERYSGVYSPLDQATQDYFADRYSHFRAEAQVKPTQYELEKHLHEGKEPPKPGTKPKDNDDTEIEPKIIGLSEAAQEEAQKQAVLSEALDAVVEEGGIITLGQQSEEAIRNKRCEMYQKYINEGYQPQEVVAMMAAEGLYSE